MILLMYLNSFAENSENMLHDGPAKKYFQQHCSQFGQKLILTFTPATYKNILEINMGNTEVLFRVSLSKKKYKACNNYVIV